MKDGPIVSGNGRSGSLRRVSALSLLAGLALVLGGAMTQGGLAMFTDTASVPDNTFTTAALFPFALQQYAISATASSQYSAGDWSAAQAVGSPDTAGCGDLETAWAPAASGSGPEWLEVSFELPVYATGLTVYETFNTGFITQVDLIDTGGGYNTIWTGTDTTGCPGQFTLTFAQTSYKVDGVRIYTQISGWEEADAVRLTGFFDGP